MIILLLILLVVFNFVIINVLNGLELRFAENRFFRNENIYTRRLYYVVPVICLICFLIGNYILSGRLFEELFYKL